MISKIAVISGLLALGDAQAVGTQTTETHPKMTWKNCAAGGSCTTVNGEVTVDANWRWLHDINGYTNCYTGNEWNSTICKDAASCATNCALDGADYSGTYGASTSGDALTLKFVTKGQYSTNIGSRMYLMNGADKYQMFKLLGNEFTFDVDLSKLGCGLNGALYFVSMDEDGGKSKYSTNKAGAKYGTGYCDAQCPRDLKFIDGKANSASWTPSTNDDNAGVGAMGSCCAEMDIWEANKISTAYTPHPCKNNAQHSCSGDACGGTYSSTRYAGDCDPDGCDFNSYRQGVKDFYGPGMTVDTGSKFSVVTQFIKGSSGDLESIKRYYVQNGKLIPNSESTISGTSGNEINTAYCSAQKTAFGDTDDFSGKGGLKQMGAALDKGMVLVMSVWDDHYANMLWLDSSYPLDKDASTPGIARGSCDTTSGVPADVESKQASDQVIYSNIRFGPINSTFTAS
ncbi:putative 1,4-beta-D-glucan cellobiohydrolase B [Pestalotiopsis fici W106-1]|uniref:Glucanase n=1 Tax=Pestalotiopsis fici (strain W106-1 / CGMCC3.15140) TaxID=1229662 RepID=W3WZA0_PESFW|nr:putative 1,4-beta-D-glucan cellobiohydrolase B [Pestalotiopsis fici W106-1]ETS78211.1 putative 1,4-beta-D-glucan cellobiohydrolase B [Pestalotiopsis fici W106-1]